GAHHDRLRRRATGAVVRAAQQIPVGDPRRAEEHVVATDQIVGGQYAIDIVSGRDDLLPFSVVLGPEFRLEFATEALHRTRCDDSLRSAPDTEQHVDTGRAAGSGDGARHIAVGDEPDPGPRLTYLFHQLVVSRAVQNAHGDIGDVTAFGAGDTSNVLRHRSGNVHAARCLRADGECLQIG